MKSLYLSLALVFAAATAFSLDAGYWRRNRGYGYGSNCGSCARNECNTCETPCRASCNPCARPACPSYVVEEEAICNPPKCVKYVEVEEPAICHRVCSWSCPPGTTMEGNVEVGGEVELVSKHSGQKHRLPATGSNY